MLSVGAEHRRAHLQDHVGFGPELVGRDDARAHLDVAAVLEVRALACACFDQHLGAELQDLLDRLGCRRNTLLVGRDFFGDADFESQGGHTISETVRQNCPYTNGSAFAPAMT